MTKTSSAAVFGVAKGLNLPGTNLQVCTVPTVGRYQVSVDLTLKSLKKEFFYFDKIKFSAGWGVKGVSFISENAHPPQEIPPTHS